MIIKFTHKCEARNTGCDVAMRSQLLLLYLTLLCVGTDEMWR
jgi:hypothetical protein